MLSIGLPCNLEYFLCVYCTPPERAVPQRCSIAILHTEPWVSCRRRNFQGCLSWGDFSPARLCLPRQGEQQGNYRGGGERPVPAFVGDGEVVAPALDLGLSPSFRRGTGLAEEKDGV